MKKILFVSIVAIALFFTGCEGESNMSSFRASCIARNNNGNIVFAGGDLYTTPNYLAIYTSHEDNILNITERYKLINKYVSEKTIKYINNTIMLLLSDYSLLISNNNGEVWKQTKITNDEYDSVYSIDYDGTTAVAGGSTIFLSYDNGNTWIEKWLNLSMTILAVKIHNGKIIAVGTSKGEYRHGMLLISNDNGETWTYGNIPQTEILVDLSCFNNNIIVIGNKGTIIVSHDNGDTWSIKNSGTTKNLFQINSYASVSIITYSFNNYLLSNDNGDTWVQKTANNNMFGVTYNGIDALTVGNNVAISRLTGTDFIALSTEPSHLHGCEVAGEVITFAQFKPNTLESPLHYCNKNGEIKSIALVKPGTRAGSRFRIKIDPSSEYAKMMLGKNNDGILAFQTYVQ